MSRLDKQIITVGLTCLLTVVGVALHISSRPIKITPAPQGCVVIEQAGFYSYHCPKIVEIVEPIIDERE